MTRTVGITLTRRQVWCITACNRLGWHAMSKRIVRRELKKQVGW